MDKGVNEGWPSYEQALIEYKAYIYPEVNHGFHNNTTPIYDEAAANWRGREQ